MSRSPSTDHQVPHLGFAAYFDQPLWRDRPRMERVARLLLDGRWPWLPWYAAFDGIERRDDCGAIRVGGKNGVEFLVGRLMDPGIATLVMRRTAGNGNHTECRMPTGRQGEQWNLDAPFDLQMISPMADLPPSKSTASWVSLVRDFVTEVRPLNAVLCPWPAFNPAISDVQMMRIVFDTRWGLSNVGVLPSSADPTPRHSIGRTFARYPRWGTYLNDAHLAAIGGVERVRAEVEPAKIERVGTVTFIQLTPSIETAMTAECGDRRRRLEALMTPILAPR